MSKINNRRVFKSTIVLFVALVMLFAFVGCGKKDAGTASTPAAATAPAPAAKATTVVPAPAPVPKAETTVAPKVEEKPAPAVVEAVKEIAPAVVETVSAISVPNSYPVELSATIGGEKFSLEAYDGYGFVYFPEYYTEENVDAFLEPLLEANSDLSDVVGWTVEEPGMAIIAYPFGLTPAAIATYSQVIAAAAN